MDTDFDDPPDHAKCREAMIPVKEVLAQIGGKWSISVITALGHRILRFSELKREIEGISQKMLTATLRDLVRKLGIPARDLLRKGEPEHAELSLDDPALGDEAAIAAMVAHPRLIERPILVRGDRAVICRPPERALGLIGPAQTP